MSHCQFKMFLRDGQLKERSYNGSEDDLRGFTKAYTKIKKDYFES